MTGARPRLPLPHLTERLVVRPPTLHDAAAIQQAVEETYAALHEWMAWAAEPQTLEKTREYIEGAAQRFRDGEDFPASAFLRSTGEFVLNSGLHPRNWEVPKFEIGYWCRASRQGQGYVTEAVRALTALAFEAMAAERVEIRCDARNERSRRVAERAGYRLEAVLRSDDRANDGSLRDTLVFVRLRAELEGLEP